MSIAEPPAKKPKADDGLVTKDMALAAPDSKQQETTAGEGYVAFRATSKEVKTTKVVPIKAINHIAFPCQRGEAETVARWYTDVLGFEVMNERPSFPFEGCWLRHPANIILHFALEDAGVPLEGRQKYSKEAQPWFERRGRHVSLEVEDLLGTMEVLRMRGIDYDWFPIPGTHGAAQLFLLDPLGNTIEIGNFGAAGLPTLPGVSQLKS